MTHQEGTPAHSPRPMTGWPEPGTQRWAAIARATRPSPRWGLGHRLRSRLPRVRPEARTQYAPAAGCWSERLTPYPSFYPTTSPSCSPQTIFTQHEHHPRPRTATPPATTREDDHSPKGFHQKHGGFQVRLLFYASKGQPLVEGTCAYFSSPPRAASGPFETHL
jgi:hypothetical protein